MCCVIGFLLTEQQKNKMMLTKLSKQGKVTEVFFEGVNQLLTVLRTVYFVFYHH